MLILSYYFVLKSTLWYNISANKNIPKECTYMLPFISHLRNLTGSFSISFSELNIFHALKHANIYKRNGFEAQNVFTVIFSLVFHHLSWNQLIHSKHKNDLPGKDCIYRFLNSSQFNWRKFLCEVASNAIHLIEPLTDSRRTNVFIVDDSPYDRSRSKKTDMLSKIFDHVTHRYFNGFHLLTLGWSDGATFIPVDFSLVVTVCNLINDISDKIDKRSLSYQRRAESKEKKTDTAVQMIRRALNHGIYADYVLMDTWFASPTMFQNIKNLKIDAICMLKKTTKHQYMYQGYKLDIKSLFNKSMIYGRKTRNHQGIISSIIVNITEEMKLKIVYVVNKNNTGQWIAIATTDYQMSEEDIIKTYEIRWQTEVFYKAIKTTFKLEKEFMTQSFESLISHTTIVLTRYIVVSWEIRKKNDVKTLGELFMQLCDDIASITFIEAMKVLLEMIEELSKEAEEKTQILIDRMLKEWYEMLPSWLYESIILSRTV